MIDRCIIISKYIRYVLKSQVILDVQIKKVIQVCKLYTKRKGKDRQPFPICLVVSSSGL